MTGDGRRERRSQKWWWKKGTTDGKADPTRADGWTDVVNGAFGDSAGAGARAGLTSARKWDRGKRRKAASKPYAEKCVGQIQATARAAPIQCANTMRLGRLLWHRDVQIHARLSARLGSDDGTSDGRTSLQRIRRPKVAVRRHASDQILSWPHDGHLSKWEDGPAPATRVKRAAYISFPLGAFGFDIATTPDKHRSKVLNRQHFPLVRL